MRQCNSLLRSCHSTMGETLCVIMVYMEAAADARWVLSHKWSWFKYC